MCGHIVLPNDVDKLIADFQIDDVFSIDKVTAGADVRPGAWAYGIVEDDNGTRYLSSFRWGFSGQSNGLLYNARFNRASIKKIWQDPFANHRIVVPAVAFYEEGLQFGISSDTMLMAGIWRKEQDGLRTAAVLTIEATGFMRKYHNRVPAIVPPDTLVRWLDTANKDGDSFKHDLYGYAPTFKVGHHLSLV